jgi:glucokinase
MSARALVADIGGTWMRLALADAQGALHGLNVMATAQHATLAEGIAAYLREHGAGVPVAAAAVAAAGPVTNGAIAMTNVPRRITREEIAQASGAARILLMNDFAAAAHGLPAVPADCITRFGGGEPVPGTPIGLVGPGTGLGVSALLPDGRGGWTVMSGEGGHVALAPHDDRESAILAVLRARHGYVPVEAVLSGPGLMSLYEALSQLDGVKGGAPSKPAEIVERARAGEALAGEVLRLFSGWLGAVAGDLALTVGARGGVYVAGGVVPKLGDLFDRALFRARFEGKGRQQRYLAPMPTSLVVDELLPLRGLARVAFTG